MKILMPSGIYYELPVKSVTGKAHQLRGLMQTIIAIDAKAEKLKSKEKQ